MKQIFEHTNEELAQRIQAGKTWLEKNAEVTGTNLTIQDEPYDDVRFQKNLAVYEALVDEYRRRGLDEVIIMKDDQIAENEKKIREQIAGGEKGWPREMPQTYAQVYSQWARYREEGLRRGLFRFYMPSPHDSNY